MAGWHHGLDGRESEWTLGVGDGQGGLACCNSWGRKESDTTENWTDAEVPILWSADVMNWLIGKTLMLGKLRHEDKESSEDDMVRWHHWLDGHKLSKLRVLVMDREAWRAAVYGVTTSQTWLSNLTELMQIYIYYLERDSQRESERQTKRKRKRQSREREIAKGHKKQHIGQCHTHTIGQLYRTRILLHQAQGHHPLSRNRIVRTTFHLKCLNATIQKLFTCYSWSLNY